MYSVATPTEPFPAPVPLPWRQALLIVTLALAGALWLLRPAPSRPGVIVLTVMLSIFGVLARVVAVRIAAHLARPEERSTTIVMLCVVAVIVAVVAWWAVWTLQGRESTDRALFQPTGGMAWNGGETVELDLPASWRARYNLRQDWREATILDGSGVPQFELIVDILSETGGTEGRLRTLAEAYGRRGGVPACETRRSIRGEVRACRALLSLPSPSTIFIMAPRAQLATRYTSEGRLDYLESWQGSIVQFSFHTVPSRLDALEPLSWQAVAGARVFRSTESR